MTDSVGFVDELERHLKQVYNAMRDGTYEFADKAPPFMEIARQHGVFTLPFGDLLSLNNDTHRKGLQIDES